MFRIVAPDLNVPSFRDLAFAAIVQVALAEAERRIPAVIVGSSLGALAALEASRLGAPAPLLLVAPAVGFGRRWIEKLPVGDPLPFFHHALGRELLIHRRFFEELAALETDREPPPAPVVIVMGTRDESVPYEHVRRVWRSWEGSGRLVEGSHFIDNPASGRVLEKLGFEPTGLIAPRLSCARGAEVPARLMRLVLKAEDADEEEEALAA